MHFKKSDKKRLKKELKDIFDSMDFISQKFLSNGKILEKAHQKFYNIYQQLGLAWEFLGLQCGHWDGFKKTRDKKELCKICGKLRSAKDSFYLLPTNSIVRIGQKIKPNSKKIFKTQKEANLLKKKINFYGTDLSVEVYNAYKSKFSGRKSEISIAPDRIIRLKERNIECRIDRYLLSLRLIGKRRSNGEKRSYEGFPSDLRKRDLGKLPILFELDRKGNLMGLTLFVR